MPVILASQEAEIRKIMGVDPKFKPQVPPK
jgi:hypothetical protein